MSYLHGTKTDIKVAEHSIQSKPERKHMHKSRTTYMITKITREHAERRGQGQRETEQIFVTQCKQAKLRTVCTLSFQRIQNDQLKCFPEQKIPN